MPKVVIYGTDFCSYCTRARMLLDRKGVSYEEIRVDTDPKLRKEMMEKSRRHTVPQIFINDEHIGGFQDLYNLDIRGELDGKLSAG